jgi:hypothetical protein
VSGVGRESHDPYTPSPVAWMYEFDSRDFIGGFPITLDGYWSGSYSIASSSTFDGPYNKTGTLGGRPHGTWSTQHVVCQIQVMNIAPGYRPPAVGCRDPRDDRAAPAPARG